MWQHGGQQDAHQQSLQWHAALYAKLQALSAASNHQNLPTQHLLQQRHDHASGAQQLTLLLFLEVLHRLPRRRKLARRALQRHRVLRHRLQLLLQRLPHLPTSS